MKNIVNTLETFFSTFYLLILSVIDAQNSPVKQIVKIFRDFKNGSFPANSAAHRGHQIGQMDTISMGLQLYIFSFVPSTFETNPDAKWAGFCMSEQIYVVILVAAPRDLYIKWVMGRLFIAHRQFIVGLLTNPN